MLRPPTSAALLGAAGPVALASGGALADAVAPDEVAIENLAIATFVSAERTITPAFHSLDVGVDVHQDLVGKTIPTAQEVEDVVAYLTALK